MKSYIPLEYSLWSWGKGWQSNGRPRNFSKWSPFKGESNPTFRSHEKKKKKTKVESKRNKNKASLQLEPL